MSRLDTDPVPFPTGVWLLPACDSSGSASLLFNLVLRSILCLCVTLGFQSEFQVFLAQSPDGFLQALCLGKESPSTSSALHCLHHPLVSSYSRVRSAVPAGPPPCHQVLATESVLSYYRIGSSSVVGSIPHTKRLPHYKQSLYMSYQARTASGKTHWNLVN